MLKEEAQKESINKIKNKLKPYLNRLKLDYGSDEVKIFYQKLYGLLREKYNINLYERKTNSAIIGIDTNKSLLDYIEIEEISVLVKEIYLLLYQYKITS